MASLDFYGNNSVKSPISPFLEMGAYEALWLEKGASFKNLAGKFASDSFLLPSDFVDSETAKQCANEAREKIRKAGIRRFGIRVHHAADYPQSLRDAKYPVEFLYYRGSWELSELPSVAVVGSRNPSPEGQARARNLTREFVKKGFSVVSGLATGIDSAAHEAALEAGGQTIAVVGTPLGRVYPPQNRDLQEKIATDHLLVSQVPVLRYSKQNYRRNRLFFPERNVTMSALTKATVIVEAGERSGALTQAKAAVHQGRKLFILDSCFQNQSLTWPSRYEKLGAIRVKEPDDIWSAIN